MEQKNVVGDMIRTAEMFFSLQIREYLHENMILLLHRHFKITKTTGITIKKC